MKMLTKFESKSSSRAKGVAFHPTRPWVLVSLHSSTIQLWDYRMGTLIDRFEEHDGPVRSVNFHPTQPLFVSGGDDYTIKVWSTITRKCIFTLSGHLDYVRTVSFHNELPWILSTSDDQTIRIWNWQNRQEIACLTGHNHYVMSAEFHPTQDLIVSSSLDQTVRVWDISGLRKKHSAPSGAQAATRSFEDQLSRQNMPQQDIFGNTDAVVKFVLEGHDRGVNWASFHPTLPLIVSGGDDRVVKLWRMSETKAWEVDTCRGHTNNVLAVLFHPTQDLIISVSEDKTIRTWDLNKRTSIKQYTRENDRFWLIAAHPQINLFAAAHDSGVMVFKLERERPPSTLFQNQLFFVNNERQVQTYNFDTKQDSLPVLSLKKIGKPWTMLRSLSYNPSEHSIIVTTGPEDSPMYALIQLPKDASGAIEPLDIRQDAADFAIFIARNRFVTYSKETGMLNVKDLNNSVTKSIKLEDPIKDLLYAGPGHVLLLKQNSIVQFDVQQKKVVAEFQVSSVKYVTWSHDGEYLALLSKHTITIVNKRLELITSMHETIRIKSAAWDETGVLLYSTLNHIKYTLLNGDNGIIKTLPNTVYVVKVQGKNVFCLTRSGKVETIKIDPTEYRFKKALVNKNFNEVLRIIKNSTLVGQNIIAYLQKKGYPEIALQFVEDPETRFELALESGDLQAALAEAQKLKLPAAWKALGEEALKQGNTQIVELVYQDQKQLEKLSFFYLINGDFERLRKMQTIAEHRTDISSLIQNSVYLNSTEKRAAVFSQAGNLPLAYALAHSNGLGEFAQQILEAAGIDVDEIELPDDISEPIEVLKPTRKLGNWPVKESAPSFFEKAMLGQLEDLQLEDAADPFDDDDNEANVSKGLGEAEDFFDDDGAEDDMGWDDEGLEVSDVEEDVEITEASLTETGTWVKNAPSNAAVHVAAGQFDSAAQLLHRQVGIVNFEPLRARFMEVYQANKVYLAGNDGLPPVLSYIRADPEEDDASRLKPYIPGYDTLEASLQEAFRLFRSNKLEDAIEVFRQVIYTVSVLAVPDEDAEAKCVEALHLCREYILGLSIELARRSLPADAIQRNLELAAYFTKAKLKPAHRMNALQVAMTQSFKHKNYATASYFAGEFLKIVSTGSRAEQAQKIKAKADTIARDAIETNFDPYADFTICASTLTPIYKGSASVKESLVGAEYQASEKGKVCKITGISLIGVPASSLRLVA
ncbi:coatomer subunit alpha [Saccharomycopsis crataegensis]|uniref:Coatomer subunit alpha n=1 Tax=Saccharomycopsis crataegensis TaxID=43959 RepID=A0AAV5QF46_9ASCO|nr:coatomer subunit alpha [Saccharomycopsis crataegensis]